MRTYDPTKVQLSFAGTPITGFAPGTFVKVTRDEDAYSKHVGAGGQVARARNANRSGSFSFTLMMSSPSNDFLSAQAVIDEQTGAGTGAVLVKDNTSTNSYASAANGWVKKIPDLERGKELGDVEWVVDADLIDLNLGGTVLT